MEASPCYTYHSVYPKYQDGAYAKMFNIESNPANHYFVENPWQQNPCLGTEVVCFDTKYGALKANATKPCTPKYASSLRSQALRNQKLRNIINNRPETQFWAAKAPVLDYQPSDCYSCRRPEPVTKPVSGPSVRPWSL